MTQAAAAITRRVFLGHIAGAYTATSLVAGVAAPSTVALLIERHRDASRAWGEACLACDANPTDDNKQIEGERAAEDGAALEALLSWRPTTLDEAAERFAYLQDHWSLFAPHDELVAMLINSMVPA